jgi:hypothetical protein
MLKPSPVFSSSNNVTTSATMACTLSSSGDAIWYVSGFEIAFGGATAGSIVAATLAGVLGGTITYPIAVPGSATSGGILAIEFNPALAGVDLTTAITLSVPAFGAGNTRAGASLHGYKGDRTLT